MARRAARTTSRTSPAAPITPLALPRHVRTLVVFGGSFDPPHVMHALAPLLATKALFDDEGWLLYVPAARSPHKQHVIASDDHRLAMLRLALDIPGQRSIWTDELDRAEWDRAHGREPAPSYTIDTLRRLRAIVPSRVTLRLIVGTDQVGAFHRWKEPREIIGLAEPLVMLRPSVRSPLDLWTQLDDRFWSRAERAAWLTRFAPSAEAPMSSTDLRAAIPNAPASLRAWFKRDDLARVTQGVARHIIRHNLYGHRPGPARPLDPADMPACPIGDDPTYVKRVGLNERILTDDEWKRVLARLKARARRSKPAPARPASKRRRRTTATKENA